MRVAIYVRVSTDEQTTAAEEQERGAVAWCRRNGHAVVNTYRDIGHSGAEWVTRPAVAELERDARATPRPWDLVVVRDVDRLGRDAVRLPMLLAVLREHDVVVMEYGTGRAVELDGVGMLVANVLAALAQLERENIARRVRGALSQKAERGLVTGGRVYGYSNERLADGVRYAVHEAEAAVVRDIFERSARGESGRTIAKALNAAKVPSPRADGGGSGSWCDSQVRSMLRSERYRGAATWGRIGSKYKGGTRERVRRGDGDVVTYAVPAIVDEDLWHAAQHNREHVRGAQGGHSHRGRRPRYLLVNHAVCGLCGGPIGSTRTSTGTGPTKAVVPAYTCLHALSRGTCEGKWRRPVDRLDGPVVDWLLSCVLDRDVVSDALAKARASIDAGSGLVANPRAVELRARVEDLERRVQRLVRAVETDDDPGVVVLLRARRIELDDARRELEDLERVTAGGAVPHEFARVLLERVTDLRPAVEAAVRERPDLVRAVLGAVLVRPIRVTPAGHGRGMKLHLDGEAAPGALLGLHIGNGGEGLREVRGVAERFSVGQGAAAQKGISPGPTLERAEPGDMVATPIRADHSVQRLIRLFLRYAA